MTIDIDIHENDILQRDPVLLETLLIDRSRPKVGKKHGHIIWATDNYESLGPEYGENEQITVAAITGDTGYIYSSAPDSAVIYKFSIAGYDLPYSPEMDAEIEFYVNPKDFETSKEHNRFATLQLIGETHTSRLGLANLLEHGMNSAPRGALNLSDPGFADLLKYIEENF